MKKAMTPTTKGMFLKMIESVWGSLRSPAARQAWARGQQSRNKTDDQIFRVWLIGKDVPGDLARRAWDEGGNKKALEYIRKQQDWIEYYNLKKEVNQAFRAELAKRTVK